MQRSVLISSKLNIFFNRWLGNVSGLIGLFSLVKACFEDEASFYSIMLMAFGFTLFVATKLVSANKVDEDILSSGLFVG